MQDSAKFAHACVSNGQLDMTLRFTFEAGSQADPPPQLPGLLELLQELALYLLDPVAKAELRNPQTWVSRHIVGVLTHRVRSSRAVVAPHPALASCNGRCGRAGAD